jgi:hypothetical protein
MSPNTRWRLRLPTSLLLITLGVVGCGERANSPAAPETADPAPPPAVSTSEDRGHQAKTENAGDVAKPEEPDNTFSNVESGEAERAASKRGHESAGEQAPATAPGSGE